MISIAPKTQVNLQPLNQCIPVTFRYDVHFTTGLFEIDNPLLARVIAGDGKPGNKRAIAIVDSGLLRHHEGLLEKIETYCDRHSNSITLVTSPTIITGGEAAKNASKLVDWIHCSINSVGLCRHSYILAIGGGAVLDAVGLAAATAHRGIRLIRIPTTVLAQNDSGVGVKNGINAFGKKNFIGTFSPPHAVINDFDFLTTLDDRDWRGGVAEAIKVALLKDVNFFEYIATHVHAIARRDLDVMQQIVYRCAQLHLNHIANGGDPFEMGSSRPLDFGHWAAHRLEHLTDYRLRHGEAVAIGIALDCTYSYLVGLLSHQQWQQILKTLCAIGFTLYVSEMASSGLFQGLTEFREHLGGELNITLLQGIGKALEVNEVNLALYEQSISILAKF
ncbi:MAG: 3-dehydroquinate synthase [Hydrococcus sp. Prado102]|nr:3-dehydroquinate synthase [Hydrococcus sp. Prado102]